MTVKDSFVKKNKQLKKPMDLMNVGFVGAASGGLDSPEASGGSTGTFSDGGKNYKYHIK